MKTNARGVALIKASEQCRLQSYLCPAGIPTIGYGHTGPETKLGQRITQHQAAEILASDLERFEASVSTLCPGVTECQFAALVSFAFNVGVTSLANSTLRKKLQQGDVPGAADEFLKWTHAAGKVLPGLEIRRAAERALFLETV